MELREDSLSVICSSASAACAGSLSSLATAASMFWAVLLSNCHICHRSVRAGSDWVLPGVLIRMLLSSIMVLHSSSASLPSSESWT